jgi:hypothetical protein
LSGPVTSSWCPRPPGTSLAERGLAVGVVSEIVAMAGLTVRFFGERAHAGGMTRALTSLAGRLR